MHAAVIKSQQDMLIRVARFNSGDGAEASCRLDGCVPIQSKNASIKGDVFQTLGCHSKPSKQKIWLKFTEFIHLRAARFCKLQAMLCVV